MLVYRNGEDDYWPGIPTVFFTRHSSTAVDVIKLRCAIPTYQEYTTGHIRMSELPEEEQIRIEHSLRSVAMRVVPKRVEMFISPYMEPLSDHQSPRVLLEQGKLVVTPIPAICDSDLIACRDKITLDDFQPFDNDKIYSHTREPSHVYVSRAGTKSDEAFREIAPNLLASVFGDKPPKLAGTSLVWYQPSQGAIEVSDLHVDRGLDSTCHTLLVDVLTSDPNRDGFVVFPDIPAVPPGIRHRTDYKLESLGRIVGTMVNPQNNMVMFSKGRVHYRAPIFHAVGASRRLLGFMSFADDPLGDPNPDNANEQYSLHHIIPALEFDGIGHSPVYILTVTVAHAKDLLSPCSYPQVVSDETPPVLYDNVVLIQIDDTGLAHRDFRHGQVCGCVRLGHDGMAVSGRKIVPLPGEVIPSGASMVAVCDDQSTYTFWRAVRESAASVLEKGKTSHAHHQCTFTIQCL